MKILFYLFAIIFAFQIIRVPGVKKLPWFFAGILFFPDSIVLFGPFTFTRLMIYSLLIAYFIENKNWLIKIKEFSLWRILLFLFIVLLLIGLMDDRHNLFIKLFFPINLFITNFFVIFLTYQYIGTLNDIIKIYKTLLVYFFIFGVYGIFNYILKENLYYTIITDIYQGFDFANSWKLGKRFTISSFSYNALYYGLLLDIIILICLFILIFSNISRNKKIILLLVLVLFFLNLFFVNSRMPILSLLIGISLFLVWGLKFKHTLIGLFIGTLFLFGIFTLVPIENQLITETLKLLTSQNTELPGRSSIEMRQIQLVNSIILFKQNPIWGNGFNYIVEDLDYSSDKEVSQSDKDMYGFESYGFILLIEQGIMGIVGNIVFFLFLIISMIKRYKRSLYIVQKLIGLNVTILIMFLVFVLGTGALSSFPFVLSVIGIGLKGIQLNQIHSI